MNANRLFKLLKRGRKSFNRLHEYKHILSKSHRILIDFSNFKNFDIFANRAMDIARTNGIKLPFDNVLLDITGITLSNNMSMKQSTMLHIIPIEISTDIATFRVMLIQDMRHTDNNIYPRLHIVSLSNDIIFMPAIDTGMVNMGCTCSSRNPFTHGQLFKQIQSFTPGFVADCGFAAPSCNSNIPLCKSMLNESKEITKLAISAMTIMTMPCHSVVKITDINMKPDNELRQMPYYIICDMQGWNHLVEHGKPLPIQFQDGDKFDEFASMKWSAPGPMQYKNYKFEPVVDDNANQSS